MAKRGRQANLSFFAFTATPKHKTLAVYGRNGLPCPRCHDTIRVRRTGPHLRATFWCGTCQPANAASPMEVTPSAARSMQELAPISTRSAA